MRYRLKLLKDKLRQKALDGAIIINEKNIFYLTGIKVPGILIITSNRFNDSSDEEGFDSFESTSNIFLTYERFKDYTDSKIRIESGIVVESIEKVIDFKNYFSSDYVIGIEEKDISVRDYKQYKELFGVHFKDISLMIEELREVKEEEEIEKISYVADKISQVFNDVAGSLEPGVSEIQVAEDIVKRLAVNMIEISGVVRVSFGTNTALKYAGATNNILKDDDIAIIRFCGHKDGYHASIGRNIFIGNAESVYPECYSNYYKLYELHDKMLRKTKNKEEIRVIAKMAKDSLSKIAWNLTYELGHGIGAEEEEYPVFDSDNLRKFKEDMVIVINPQIYINSEYGLIIEDTVQLTHSNFILLTKADREKESLELSIGNFINKKSKNILEDVYKSPFLKGDSK